MGEFEGKLNIYTCELCRGFIVTRDVNEGVTPFMTNCRATPQCSGMMKSSFYRVFDQSMRETHQWYRPPADQVLPPHYAEHVRKGGLILRENPDNPLSTPFDITARNLRQQRASDWAVQCFTITEAMSLPQRGLRHAEEAIELAQSCGSDPAKLHALIDYIFAREPGALDREIGGSGLTLLVLAQAAGLSADSCELAELTRVLSKPVQHFTERNKVKNDAGFKE